MSFQLQSSREKETWDGFERYEKKKIGGLVGYIEKQFVINLQENKKSQRWLRFATEAGIFFKKTAPPTIFKPSFFHEMMDKCQGGDWRQRYSSRVGSLSPPIRKTKNQELKALRDKRILEFPSRRWGDAQARELAILRERNWRGILLKKEKKLKVLSTKDWAQEDQSSRKL